MTVFVEYVRKNPVFEARRGVVCPCDHVRVHRARAEDIKRTLYCCNKPKPVFVGGAQVALRPRNIAACWWDVRTVLGSACRVHQCVRLRTTLRGASTYSCLCDVADFIFRVNEHSLPPDTYMSCRRSQCPCREERGSVLAFRSAEHAWCSLTTSLHRRLKRRASASVSSRTCNGVVCSLNSSKDACIRYVRACIRIYTHCESISALLV